MVELPCDLVAISDPNQFPSGLFACNNLDARPRQAQQASEELNTGSVSPALRRRSMEFQAEFARRV
jgi:hypothetical protein